MANEKPYEPTSHLGKLLLALVQEVGNTAPMAFKDVHVLEALKQADGLLPKDSTLSVEAKDPKKS